MALYLGSSDKLKINLGGIVYRLNLYSETPITSDIRLVSSDGYILRDSSGLYLITKDSVIISENRLLSSDNYILKDSNGLYLNYKGE